MPLVSPESSSPIDATVFIPTYNGEKYLDRLLCAVESQEFDGNFDILIIDSGSTDSTLEIIAAHPQVRLVQIPSEEFGHGKTRNLAASIAGGTNIVFLSHDAIPVGAQWLTNITAPLDPAGLDCVGVVGKHIARADCFPLLKYEIGGVFAQCGPDGKVTVIDGSKFSTSELSAGQLFYSDVNSAARRDFLLNTIPYQDVNYSEDVAFAKDLLDAGFKKAYAATAIVEHSNDVTFAEYPKRIFDETLGMRRVGQGRQSLSWVQAKLRAVRDILMSAGRILRDKDYSFVDKLKWLVVNPAYAWVKWRAIYSGMNVDLTDSQKIASLSLESSRKTSRI